jgi:hypothetical protein
VQHRAADYYIGDTVFERHLFERLGAEILRWQPRGEAADLGDGARVGIGAENFVTLPKEIYQIAAGAAARVKDLHSRAYAAFEKLVEEVDIDRAELFLKIRHYSLDSMLRRRRTRGAMINWHR